MTTAEFLKELAEFKGITWFLNPIGQIRGFVESSLGPLECCPVTGHCDQKHWVYHRLDCAYTAGLLSGLEREQVVEIARASDKACPFDPHLRDHLLVACRIHAKLLWEKEYSG